MWIILKFFLLATEISVVVFSLLFGELTALLPPVMLDQFVHNCISSQAFYRYKTAIQKLHK